MSILDALIFFCDRVCTSSYVVHTAFGVFFGFLIGFARPRRAFYAASLVGISKETIDFFKHSAESASFHYLTDSKYGLYDGVEDLLFWMIGGYIAYRLLQRGHLHIHEHYAKRSKELLDVPNLSNLSSSVDFVMAKEIPTSFDVSDADQTSF